MPIKKGTYKTAKTSQMHANNFLVGVCTIDSKGKIDTSNDALLEITGYPSEKLSKASLAELVTEKNKFMAQLVAFVHTGNPSSESYDLITKKGIKPILLSFDMLLKSKEFTRIVLHLTEHGINSESELHLQKNDSSKAADSAPTEINRLRAVLDTLPAHILLLSPDYRVLLANKAYKERFGDYEGRKCYEHLFGRNKPCLNCQSHLVLANKKPRRWEWIGPDARTYNIYDFLFTDLDGTEMIMKMGWDITERKRAETEMAQYQGKLETQIQERTESLIQSEERFRLALKNSPVSVAVQDKNLKFIWAYDHNIINPKEIIGKTDFDLFLKDDAEYLVELKKKVLHTQKEIHEKMWLDRGGKRFYDLFIEPLRNEAGKITGIGITSVDLTQMKLAEEELSIAKEKWERTFDSVPDMIAILDKNHRMVAANKAMAARLKLTPEECIGKPCFTCVHNAKNPIDDCPHLKTIKDKEEHVIELHEDNINGDFLVSTTPLFDSSGELTGSVHVARDITERKNSERSLQNLLKDKEMLLREVHHRVKNNLQILYSLINMQSRRTDNKVIRNALEDGQSRIKSMALINEILYKSENITNLDIRRYLNELVQYLRETYKDKQKNIDVKVDIDSLSLTFDAAISCGLIVNELVSNSLKYAFPSKNKGTISVRLKRNGNNALLEVTDDGIGMPKSFDIEKTESLGLQLVHSLTHQIDGKIDMKTSKGLSFRIVFPLEKSVPKKK